MPIFTTFNTKQRTEKQMINYILSLFFVCLFGTSLLAQNDEFPKVINVSQNSTILEELSADYKGSLFLASDTNVVKTMQNWKHLLVNMETYAKDIDFDLKGVKFWVKIFWAKNGTIDHITYILSDSSININTIDLEAFLRSFMRNYKLPLNSRNKFSYDGRVMFPLYLMR